MANKQNLNDRFSDRLARIRRTVQSRPLLRVLGGRGAATLLVGAALSIGGLSEAMDHVHFLVEKDLDAVRVVRQDTAGGEKVVANLSGDFAGNTVFKLSQLLPDKYVTRELSLFDDRWVSDVAEVKPAQSHRNVFVEEIKRINIAIKEEFFSTSMPYGDLIHEKAEKYDVDPLLVAAVIEQESRFRKTARSPVGAKGLMQLMPRTGRWMGAQNLYDPEQNVDAGVKYIKYLQQQFDGNLNKTIAAYNAGEGNVRRYKGVPPFRETQHYVKRVLGNYRKRNDQYKRFEKEQLRSGGGVADPDGVLTVR